MTGPRPIKLYVGAICTLAAALLVATDWSQLTALSQEDCWGLLTLALLALFAEHQALRTGPGLESGGSSVGFLPLFTVLVLFGPPAAVATMLVNGTIVQYGIRRKPALRANFNIAQYVMAAALGGMAYSAADGSPLLLTTPSPDIIGQVGPFVLFGVVVLALNNFAVAGAVAISERLPLTEVLTNVAYRSGVNILSDLLVAPVAIAIAALYLQIGVVGILLAVLPLLFIRHAYHNTFRLQQANRDLLRALVKAIETRDPYTSGHSLRVSRLSKQIAEVLGLSRTETERIRDAGLLHDIGKIEASYSDILLKSDSLSTEERQAIESHVVKGEELLRGLKSVPVEVIRMVRHHHERFDGGGYPDRLSHKDIPTGARIIAVCDAVDAMLSNRPYRDALPVAVVRRELDRCSGSQFDPQVVAALLRSELLDEYAAIMGAASGPYVEPHPASFRRSPVATRTRARSGRALSN